MWLRNASRVTSVRSGGEGEEEVHMAHWEDDIPSVKDYVLVARRVAQDRSEYRLNGPFAYLVEGDALGKVLDGVRVECSVNIPRLVEELECASRHY